MNAAAPERVTATADGVRVTKALLTDRFDHPTVELTMEVTTEEPVRITVYDHVPGGSTTEYVGFHQEYGGDYWTVADDELVFERVFEAEETFTSIYGVQGLDVDRTIEFEPPRITVDSITPAGRIRDRVSSVFGEQETQTNGRDQPATPEPSEGINRAQEKDPYETADEAESVGEAADAESPDDLSSDQDSIPHSPLHTPEDDSIGSQLASELANDEIPRQDLLALRNAVGGVDHRTEARIQHLQQEVADLSAFTSIADELLDENGPVHGDVAALRDDMDRLEREVNSFQQSIHADLEELRADIKEVRAFHNRLRAIIGQLGQLDEFD